MAGLPTLILKGDAALEQILKNPDIGGFDKTDVLKNPDRQSMEVKIEEFLADSHKDDLVLLYFSGHGVVDEAGNFYLSSRSTCLHENRLRTATAVKAKDVHSWMTGCKSKRQAVILDCCNAGAFAKGLTAKDVGKIDIQTQLGGEGRVILTAATSTQYAFEQDGLDLSIYTHYLVEGLEKGAADINGDGQISIEELHEYISKKVKEAAPAMTPEIYNLARDTEPLLIARSPKNDPQLRYRQAVRKVAEEDEGNFGPINRRYLNSLGKTLNLDSPITQKIEEEELEPYCKRKEKEAEYSAAFVDAVQLRYPLNEKDRNALKRFQQLLSLRDEDINRIEQAVLSEWQLPSPQPAQPSNSPSPTIELASEKGIDYTKLRDLLEAGDWREADEETYRVMIQAVGKEVGDYFTPNELQNFPCTDLKTIDSLWVKYSNGKFGFSVQKKIYVECGAKLDGSYPGDKIWKEFCIKVGWIIGVDEVPYKNLKADPDLSPPGEFPGRRRGGLVGWVGGGGVWLVVSLLSRTDL